MKTQRKQSQTTRQKLYRQIIIVLLLMQTTLIGIKAENRIHHGDSPIEVLIWMINQCIPVLKQASKLEDKDKNNK